MSDVYVPGIKSRFNTEQIIEGLMNVERLPRDRIERNIDSLQVQKGYWQELGRRITSLREASRFLFSFQNPFNDRIAASANDSAITAIATREAIEQNYSFTVKQVASADRFLSQPLDERMRVDAGNYKFTVGDNEISINFRGGTLRDFVEALNRRGQDKIAASLMAVQSGTRSLLIESKLTGQNNRLTFGGDSVEFVKKIGMMEVGNDSNINVQVNDSSVQKTGANAQHISINDGIVKVAPRASASIPMNVQVSSDSTLMLRLETQTKIETSDAFNVPQAPPGPTVPAGSITYGGITINNDPSQAPFPELKAPPPPARLDTMEVLSVSFSDGSSAKLSPITDTNNFTTRQYSLAGIAAGRTITALNIENENTHREVSVGKIEVFDPATAGGLKPANAVANARDAIITMEGIEIIRPTNQIDDLIPGVTLNIKGVSEKPIDLNVMADREGVKEAIISFVGNYNRLMAEINVLTSTTGSSSTRRVRDENGNWKTEYIRNPDTAIVDELTYLTKEESDEMKARLGALSRETTLSSLKNNLRMAVSSAYPTSLERELALLAQMGISTNVGINTGYSPSQLRGYLQIDEKKLDFALETQMPAIKELFASDTSGDMLADTGAAFNVDLITRPFVETGGIISLKTNTLDSRISQDERRITSLDRQLEIKEQELRIQYAQMEAAYAQMERMSQSFDNFNQQNRGR